MMVCSYFTCCRFHWCGSRVWKARDTRSCGENCRLHSWREHAASGGAAGGTRECCHLRLTDQGLQRVSSPCTLNESRYSHTKEPAVVGRSRVQFPAQERDFSLFQNIQTGFKAHLASCSLGARSKAARSEGDHSPLSSTKVKIEWIYTSAIPVCIY